jgi:hypothetical protein
MTAHAFLVALLLAVQVPGAPSPFRGEGIGGRRLPAKIDARYRMELAGEHVGWARLALSCAPSRCDALWESALRVPAEASGRAKTRPPQGGRAGARIPPAAEVISLRVEIEAAPTGTARRVRTRATAAGRTRRTEAGSGPIPASLAEVMLAYATEGERRCVAARDEESGRAGEACARRRGAWLEGEVLGEPIRFRAVAGEAPEEVLLPAQGARFVADPAAALPARAPRLFGTTVPAPVGSPARVCGATLDAASPPAPATVPRTFPLGETCREQTARYLDLAAREGLRGRHAIGVAFDGRAWVWHEWAELLAGGQWIPVDPSFEQAPADGPRFTLARFEDADSVARAEAGRRVLACWSGARVEAIPRPPSQGSPE